MTTGKLIGLGYYIERWR